MSTMLAKVEHHLQDQAASTAEDHFERLRFRLHGLLNEYGASVGGQFCIKSEAISAFLEPMRAEILKREQQRVTDAFAAVVAERAEKTA